MKKLIKYSMLVGVLAGAVVLISNILQSFNIISVTSNLAFVTFICWSTYFLYGSKPSAAICGCTSMLVGIICAIFIFVLMDILRDLGIEDTNIALPLAVAIGVVLMCMAEKLPIGNNVAAVFVGGGLFFALMETPVAEKGYLVVAIGELIYAILGFLAGYLTICISDNVRE
ncbi:hypothetical protein M2146_003031 [Lachnospiraceae bacterium PF1-22]|uniref:DUF1097 domain-containing protein n=1 Tax=Ohessyouella blattaphilus TaxID=2949333 RepID=UPI003E2E69F1